MRRENAGVYLDVIAWSESDEAIQFAKARPGLLRGACHRARIRATRWLAMTMGRIRTIVMPGHSRSKNGVASARLCAGHPRPTLASGGQDV